MKKAFLLIASATAILALASCSKEKQVEVNQNGAIGFRPMIQNGMRAESLTLAKLNEFKVTVFNASTNDIYFEDTAKKQGDTNVFDFAPTLYYWKSYNLNCYAYAPTSISATITKDAKTIKDFTPDTDITKQQDVIVAYNQGVEAQHAGTGIPMHFKHILSQISVQAKNSATSTFKIEVAGVRLVNIGSKGTFTFPTEYTAKLEGTAPLLAQNLWALTPETLSAYSVKKKDADVTLTAEAQSIMFENGSFMLIPQQLTEWVKTPEPAPDAEPVATPESKGAYISVLCKISKIEGDNKFSPFFPETEGKYAYAMVPVNTNWLPGKHYKYTLTFGDGTDGSGLGKIDPTPNPDKDDNVDENPVPGKKPGDDILGKPIKFVVDVDDWVEEATDINM